MLLSSLCCFANTSISASVIVKRMGRRKREAAKNAAAMNSTEWFTMAEACAEAKHSKPILYYWINEGWVDSFVLKTRPDSQAGTRLIRRSSLMAFLDKQYREQQIKPAIVRRPGVNKEGAA